METVIYIYSIQYDICDCSISIFIKRNIMKLKLHIIIMKQNDILFWIELKKTMMKYLYIMMNMKIKSTKKILVILKKEREGHFYTTCDINI